ncbi:hypothetical protein [Tahibacter soli]|uniref:Uncharacterized protein n=1 Tax=Tahibacter soli TaxID=2983605 RepID=A0A9X4BH63_9GAMM|nr:hypothetical protein [Tahibacter soli]MDC8013740.1 hypothetical protein [Tahibacter soli]
MMIEAIRCEIDGVVVDSNLVGVDTYEFGRRIPLEYAMTFSVDISRSCVNEKFGDFYKKFIEKESEDEGFNEELSGVYLDLVNAGYPSLEKMFVEHSLLLADVIYRVLPGEFMGFIFGSSNSLYEKKYMLQTLSGVYADHDWVRCKGFAFLNVGFQKKR